MWSRGAVQRSGDVIDNFHCSADSVSQCEPVAVHHGHGTAAEVIPSECEFNYLLFGDSYLTEYFRFVGIYSLNTETRVGFPDNVNYVILWITVDYESSYPERNTRITRAEFPDNRHLNWFYYHDGSVCASSSTLPADRIVSL